MASLLTTSALHTSSLAACRSASKALRSATSCSPQRSVCLALSSTKQHRITASRPLQFRVMATAQETTELDKSTPEQKWKEMLNPEEYNVLRQKGTERAGTGKYNKFYEDGIYKCAGCSSPLYESETKFNSGCGWPAFYGEIPGALEKHVDNTMGMRRIEITCAKCGGHLGHIFENEGFDTPTNVRHCVNSVSIKFEPKN